MRVPGACGELWQGTLDGEQPALVSCPIDWFVQAQVEPCDVWDLQELGEKARNALQFYLVRYRDEPCGRVVLHSPLPKAKGLGSSTADIAAVLYAVAEYHGRYLSPDDAAAVAVEVEPTSGMVFPGLAIFNHRGGGTPELLGEPPDVGVLVLVFEGQVDTLAYNADYKAAVLAEMILDHREALECVKRGMKDGNLWELGYGSTLSARCHQRVLYKPQLEKVIRASEELGAYGVTVAHSGTAIGILHDAPEILVPYFQDWPRVEMARPHRLVGGGPYAD